MVRAILAGQKVQTRRVVKPQPDEDGFSGDYLPATPYGRAWRDTSDTGYRCPYGHPGDRLWVRETWGCKAADRPGIPDGRKPQPGDAIQYFANDADAWQWREPGSLPWRPSIHMPRWACRLELEITGVRVERLNDITEMDAEAEGAIAWSMECPSRVGAGPRTAYRALWEAINGAGSWAANPWVWVIEFKRVTP